MRLDFSKLSRPAKNQAVIFSSSTGQIAATKKTMTRPTAPAKSAAKQRPVIAEEKDGFAEKKHQPTDVDLIREFMEVDGLTLEEAQAMAAISIKPSQSRQNRPESAYSGLPAGTLPRQRSGG